MTGSEDPKSQEIEPLRQDPGGAEGDTSLESVGPGRGMVQAVGYWEHGCEKLLLIANTV